MKKQIPPHKKMKLSDLQPVLRLNETSAPKEKTGKKVKYSDKVPSDIWDPLRDSIYNLMPSMFNNVLNTLEVIIAGKNLLDKKQIENVTNSANKLTNDTNAMIEKYVNIRNEFESKINNDITPEEALSVSFILHTLIDEWVDSARTLIVEPSQNLLTYFETKINEKRGE